MKQWYYHNDFPKGRIYEVGEEPEGCVDHPDNINAATIRPQSEPAPKKKAGRPKKVADE